VIRLVWFVDHREHVRTQQEWPKKVGVSCSLRGVGRFFLGNLYGNLPLVAGCVFRFCRLSSLCDRPTTFSLCTRQHHCPPLCARTQVGACPCVYVVWVSVVCVCCMCMCMCVCVCVCVCVFYERRWCVGGDLCLPVGLVWFVLFLIASLTLVALFGATVCRLYAPSLVLGRTFTHTHTPTKEKTRTR
jgi:hypothetical protein